MKAGWLPCSTTHVFRVICVVWGGMLNNEGEVGSPVGWGRRGGLANTYHI